MAVKSRIIDSINSDIARRSSSELEPTIVGAPYWSIVQARYVILADPEALKETWQWNLDRRRHNAESAASPFNMPWAHDLDDALYIEIEAAGLRKEFAILNDGETDPAKWKIDTISFLVHCQKRQISLHPQLQALIHGVLASEPPRELTAFPAGYLSKSIWRLGEACCYLTNCIIFQTDEERQRVDLDLWRLSTETEPEAVEPFHMALFTENGLVDFYTKARIAGRDGQTGGGFDYENVEKTDDTKLWEIKPQNIIAWHKANSNESELSEELLQLINEVPARINKKRTEQATFIQNNTTINHTTVHNDNRAYSSGTTNFQTADEQFSKNTSETESNDLVDKSVNENEDNFDYKNEPVADRNERWRKIAAPAIASELLQMTNYTTNTLKKTHVAEEIKKREKFPSSVGTIIKEIRKSW